MCGGQLGTQANFFQVLWLSMPVLIPPIVPFFINEPIIDTI
jgi:hypothetical protein